MDQGLQGELLQRRWVSRCVAALVTALLAYGVQEHCPQSVIVLVGNKADCTTSRVVSQKEGDDFALVHNMRFLECSARTKHNVVELFTLIGQALVGS